MATLPYVSTPGNVEKALNGIRTAATPPTVSQDFVKTILGITGGSGNQITAYLKKIGFAATDGTPTEIYKQFRNSSTEGKAAAAALRTGYAPLYVRNEYMHKLNDEQLRGLIVEETGASSDSNTVSITLSCIKGLKKFAKWDAAPVEKQESTEEKSQGAGKVTVIGSTQSEFANAQSPTPQSLGLNLGYTINLNLPATSDPAVFNAIFKALKEHLLKPSND
jgi:Family of unknown function (DUF5343)